MKLATAKDAMAVDPRAQSGKQPLDTMNKDGSAAAFEGLLAEIGTDPKASDATDASASTAKTAVPPTLVRAAPALPTSAMTAGTDETSRDTSNETLVSALMDILGQAVGPKTAVAATPETDPKAAAPQTSVESSDAFGSVLKKLSAKDEAADDTATPTASAASGPTDLMSMLALGAAVPGQPVPQATAQSGTTAEGQTSATRLPLMPTGTTTSGDTALAAAPAAAQEVLVSEVAIATHLAPVNPAQGASSTSSSGAATAKLGSATVTASAFGRAPETEKAVSPTGTEDPKGEARPSTSDSSAKTASDDVAAPVRLEREPTANAPQPGVTFGPTRAIATAIATVATQVATRTAATAETDSPKAPLAVARTLTLQMSPAQLGTVDIKLHMTGQALDVQLTVSSPETLGIVSRERDTLAVALHDQNYQLNSLVIQDGGAAASSGGNNATQGNAFSSAGSDRQAGSGSDSQSGGRQGQGRQQPWDDAPRGAAPARPSDARSGALFV